MSTWMGDSIWGINFYASFSQCPSLKYTGQSGLTLRVIYLFEKIKCIAKFNQFQNQDFVGIKKITKQISVSTLAKTIHRYRFANVWKTYLIGFGLWTFKMMKSWIAQHFLATNTLGDNFFIFSEFKSTDLFRNLYAQILKFIICKDIYTLNH